MVFQITISRPNIKNGGFPLLSVYDALQLTIFFGVSDCDSPSHCMLWQHVILCTRMQHHVAKGSGPSCGKWSVIPKYARNITGWWLTYPSEKYEFVNGKDGNPMYYGK